MRERINISNILIQIEVFMKTKSENCKTNKNTISLPYTLEKLISTQIRGLEALNLRA